MHQGRLQSWRQFLRQYAISESQVPKVKGPSYFLFIGDFAFKFEFRLSLPAAKASVSLLAKTSAKASS